MKRLFLILLLAMAVPGGAGAAPALRSFTAESWLQLRSAYAGKPLIVHFWGVTCAPCLEELPHVAALLRDHPGMAVMLVHAETAPPARVARVLERSGLSGHESWMSFGPVDQSLRSAVDPDWIGEMPRTMLIARDGSVTTISGKADMDRLARWWTEQAP